MLDVLLSEDYEIMNGVEKTIEELRLLVKEIFLKNKE